MCYYCDDRRYEPFNVAQTGVSIDRMFENPPVNYARYGRYPRHTLPPHKADRPTTKTWICFACGTNILERERTRLKELIQLYKDEGSPIPREMGDDIKFFGLENFCSK